MVEKSLEAPLVKSAVIVLPSAGSDGVQPASLRGVQADTIVRRRDATAPALSE